MKIQSIFYYFVCVVAVGHMAIQSYESRVYGYLRSPVIRIGLELAAGYFLLPRVPELARLSTDIEHWYSCN